MLIRHMGAAIDHARLNQHYRNMAHADPSYARFWRMRCRVAIQATRDALASLSMARAA